jgi:hypothetical protein
MHVAVSYYRHQHYNPTREQLPQTHTKTALTYQDPRAHTAAFILNLLATTVTTISLHLPRHNGDDHYRLTGTGFQSDASKEEHDATDATVA